VHNREVKDDYERIISDVASKILVNDSINERNILLDGVNKRDAIALSDLFTACYKRLTPEQHKKHSSPSSIADHPELKNDYTELFYSSIL
jgi:hypothetical protein